MNNLPPSQLKMISSDGTIRLDTYHMITSNQWPRKAFSRSGYSNVLNPSALPVSMVSLRENLGNQKGCQQVPSRKQHCQVRSFPWTNLNHPQLASLPNSRANSPPKGTSMQLCLWINTHDTPTCSRPSPVPKPFKPNTASSALLRTWESTFTTIMPTMVGSQIRASFKTARVSIKDSLIVESTHTSKMVLCGEEDP